MKNIFGERDIMHIQRAIDNRYQASMDAINRFKEDKATKDDRQLLLDIVSDDFSRSGLDANDEPTDYGLKLEALIDKLSN